MKWFAMITAVTLLMTGCNTYHAMEGDTSSSRIVGGMNKDAAAAGDTVKRAANGIGDAFSKALK